MIKRPTINTYTFQYNIGINIFRYNLLFYRKQHNLSQNRLSMRTGLQRSYIAELELGKRNPTISKVYQIAISLRLEPWRLLKPITLKEKLYGIENNFTPFDITLTKDEILTKGQYMNQLFENIRMIRKKKGWAQCDLAQFSGLSEIFIQQIEQGKKEPSLESISKLAMAFNIPVWRLIKCIDKNSIWFNHNMWL